MYFATHTLQQSLFIMPLYITLNKLDFISHSLRDSFGTKVTLALFFNFMTSFVVAIAPSAELNKLADNSRAPRQLLFIISFFLRCFSLAALPFF